MKAVTAHDLYDITSLSQLKASPQAIAYVKTQMDEETDSYEKELWVKQGDNSYCILQKQAFTTYLWEDHQHVLVQLPYAKQKTPFIRIDIQTLQQTPAFALPYEISEIQLAEKQRYVFVAEENIQPKREDDVIELTQIPFWNNGEGIISGKRRHLYVYEADTQTCTPLLQEHWDVEHVAVTANQIVCSARKYTTKLPWSAGIYRFTTQDDEKTEILAPGSLRIDEVVCAQDTIYYVGTDGKAYGNEEAGDIYQWHNGQTTKCVDSEYYLSCNIVCDCHIGATTQIQAANDALFYVKTKAGHCRLYQYKDGQETCLTPQANMVRGFAIAQDTIYTIEMEAGRLEELYVYEGNTKTQLTTWNEAYQTSHAIASAKEITFTNTAQQPCTGWVLYPKDYDAKKHYPCLLSIHGGPRCAFGNVFIHEMQMFASMGYFVCYVNPRGSDSYGEAYADLRGKYGTIDYEDLMSFLDAVLAQLPSIDEQRLGVLGGSYGGFMTNWIIGHTSRFAAAAPQRSVANWVSDYGISCIGYSFDPNEMQATPWQKMEKMWQASPLAYANKATTPTLFIHSLEDYNCPLSEGLQMFTALQVHGVATKMCLFPGENHELSRSGKPKHRITRLQEMAKWFDTYLKK